MGGSMAGRRGAFILVRRSFDRVPQRHVPYLRGRELFRAEAFHRTMLLGLLGAADLAGAGGHGPEPLDLTLEPRVVGFEMLHERHLLLQQPTQ